MKTKITYLISLMLFALSGILNTNAQTTGSFSDTVLFNSQNRTISCYVPINYDTSINYQLMICLHGSGDNSNNYRNALINTLNWKTVFTNTIFICPDGGDDYYSNFSEPQGDEEIIQESINYAKQNYKIDTAKIILQGFSLGGRSALKYGLDNPTKFKGLLLNTPAIQGLDDALNKIPYLGMYYNYANASKIPIYITCGGSDNLYTCTIEPLHEQLKKNNSKVKYLTVTGLGHTIPNSTYTSPCISFFENPYTVPYDLDIFEIDLAERFCDTLIKPKIYVRNLGSNNITSFKLNYQLNNVNGTYNWSGNIAGYEHALITLPQLITNQGGDSLVVSIDTINTAFSDTMTANNQMLKKIIIETTGTSYPVFEGFEGNYDNWIFPETGSLFEWYEDNDIYRTGKASIGACNTILMFYTDGDIESFLSPVIDLTSVSNPKMAFEYAYNYHKYTPPYFTNDTIFADTLDVSISLDCGITFQSLFKKGGADLATAQSPILNPLTLQQAFFTPKSNEWKTEVIDLKSFANEENVIIKFSNISNMGGCMNIDNINFAEDASVDEKDSKINLSIYPNPSTGIFTISIIGITDVGLSVANLQGQIVYNKQFNNNTPQQIDLTNQPKGIYFVKVQSNNVMKVEKLIIQ